MNLLKGTVRREVRVHVWTMGMTCRLEEGWEEGGGTQTCRLGVGWGLRSPGTCTRCLEPSWVLVNS